jgi:hypothetical protein
VKEVTDKRRGGGGLGGWVDGRKEERGWMEGKEGTVSHVINTPGRI